MQRFPETVNTPVGQACSDCTVVIQKGDWGQIMPHVTEKETLWLPVHGECLLRQVTGGIEHLTAPAGHPVGSCYEGSTLTRRESALAAYAYRLERQETPIS